MQGGERRPHIVVCRAGALGDFLLTLPVFQALRQMWPAAWLEVVATSPAVVFARAAGLVDATVSLEGAGWARWFAPLDMVTAADHERWSRPDVVLTYLHDPDGIFAENLRRAGARRVIAHTPLVQRKHAIDHFLEPLVAFGYAPTGNEYARLDLPAEWRSAGRRRLAEFGRPALILHPGSGSRTKNWPLENFLRLAGSLQQAAVGRPAFLLGEAETGLESCLRTSGGLPVLTGLSLREVAELLLACDGYVGNDSGITHLAAALGVRVVGIFGATDAAVWAPRGPHVRIVSAGADMRGATVSAVVEALKSVMAGAASG